MKENPEIDQRNTVLTMLIDTIEKGEFSQNVISRVTDSMNPEDRGFIMRLYLGTLERVLYIDHILDRYSKVKVRKMKPVIRNILRLSVYQLLFMDAVPDFAVLNEAGRLTARRGLKNLKPFVNGVLRSIQKDIQAAGDTSCFEKDMPRHIQLCVPQWMYEMVCEEYGTQAADKYFAGTISNDSSVGMSLNILKKPEQDILDSLISDGCEITEHHEEFHWTRVKLNGNITSLRAFKEGLVYVQDKSSASAGHKAARALKENAVSVKTDEDQLIIDVCAAPGGKSICTAIDVPEAKIISRDLTEEKVNLIRDNIARLGIANISPEVADASERCENLENAADLVIADVPCSGIGVISGKPDIKLRLTREDIQELTELQRKILANVKNMVKSGGILAYSTCTIDRYENNDNVKWFSENFEFDLISEETMLPEDGTDGFYIAILKKH